MRGKLKPNAPGFAIRSIPDPSQAAARGLALIESSAAGFFVIDEDAQEYDNKVPGTSDSMTRGSTTGSDTNDPSVYGGQSQAFIRCQNGTGNSVSVPDEAALDITDDLDIRMHLAPDGWSSGAGFLNKAASAWAVIPNSSFRLSLYINGTQYNSTVGHGFANGEWGWIRITRDRSSGDITFYTAADQASEPASWTQLGATVAGTTAAIVTNSTDLYIMANTAGSGQAGGFRRAIVYDTIDGSSPVLDINVATDNSSGSQTAFTATTGQTVTISRATSGLKTLYVAANQYLAQADGVDDYFQLPASCTPTFTATSGAATVLMAVRRFGAIGTSWLYSSESALNDGFALFLGSSGTTLTSRVGGSTALSDDPASGPIADGSAVVVGAVIDAGTNLVYDSINGLGTTVDDISGVGTITHGTSVLMAHAHSVSGTADADLFAFVFFDSALSESEITDVTAYLESLL